MPHQSTLKTAAALALILSISPALSEAHTEDGTLSAREKQVVALLKSLETGEAEPVAVISPETYIQHNLSVPDGVDSFRALQSIVANGQTEVDTVRVFEDGDYVFAHTAYTFDGPMAGFDIFRFEGDQIVEHWDNLQPMADPNPSGRTMVDGATDLAERTSTEENKALVRSFVEQFLVDRNFDALPGFFDGDTYIQHNPQVADGLSGVESAFAALPAAGIELSYDTVHYVLGEGNFVLVASEGRINGQPTAFYDMFRTQDGKIAEHWDTVAPIPTESDWQNDNGKF
ncbi:nuclear transport factor 2 family protein [Thioclava sp. SK-1]|uniref:nuclear transport factor 2 family protein n=1 Tax=Thioclava sp. SK-1 TaxID=1889770 RepID=UPI000AFD72C0|nr:nuclear transport factor 2 family protein [Thioclava sp. SK-1]